MSPQDEIARLRALVAEHERNSRKSRWILRQLLGKITGFPRDVTARFRNSLRKKRERAAFAQAMSASTVPAGAGTEQTDCPGPVPTPRPPFFHVHPSHQDNFLATLTQDERAKSALAEMETFCGSAEMVAQIAAAAAIDPEVGSLNGYESGYLSPWHDGEWREFQRILQRLPQGPFDSVVLVPFGKLGGADLVGGLLASAVADRGRTLIIRTDRPDWDRPDWYPADVPTIDISADFATLTNRTRALYLLLQHIGARSIFNVNSRLAFDTFVEYGARLAFSSRLHAYYFCADRDHAGNEVGYPIWYFANILQHLSVAMIDTASLAHDLTERYCLPDSLSSRLRTIYTPTRIATRSTSLAKAQIASSPGRSGPRIFWGGRLDRQKRFDLVIALARLMPDVQFDCWGKAVLDAPPDLAHLPANLTLHPPFADYADLPLTEADGWLYTSDWDGLPTILIDLGAMGMPIVASSVGGVPELIDEATGWPVDPAEGLKGYERAVRQMLQNADDRQARAEALQALVARRHAPDLYRRTIAEFC